MDYQRINHFLNSTEITRKDRLYVNFSRLRDKFGNKEFSFLPETFILPEQVSLFRDTFTDIQQRGSKEENIWIVKPASSSRGRGIYLLSDLKDLPKEEGEFVVSKYISNPLLISGYKFDVRVYVLVTSVDPLKIYVYNEGLVRFASEQYSKDLNKGFQHLTNYSINKKSESFV